MTVGNILLPGLGGSDEKASKETSSTSSETKIKATDLGVVEVSDEEEHPDVVALKSMLAEAHDSLDGRPIGDISLAHPYWNRMNAIRAFKAEKGLL